MEFRSAHRSGMCLCAMTIGISAFGAVLAQETDQIGTERLQVAQYTASDQLIYPEDADRWVVVGANIGGVYSEAEFNPDNPGQIGVVQMEPSAYAHLLENGKYAEGTMFLLSFYKAQEKPQPDLNGFVQGDVTAREIHIIDSVKYEDGRGFYMSAADGGNLGTMLPAGNECVQCHIEHGDFGGTFAQFYPLIRKFVSQDRQ